MGMAGMGRIERPAEQADDHARHCEGKALPHMVPSVRLTLCRSSKLRLTPPEPDFTPGDKGFDDKDATGLPYDLLGRKAVGKQLSDLIERIEEPLVIALDGGWGSGKSHFLKLWTGAHRKENGGTAKVIYFDAFEHDYLNDPLVGLVGAILQEPGELAWQDAALHNIKSAASKLLRPATRIGIAVATAGASELAVAAFDPLVQATGKEAEKAIDAMWAKEASRKQAMRDFRKALSELAKDDTGNPQKLVFIVDELDRCRPDYALSLLEVTKHFFTVPNVHFVLGVNLTALENCVRVRYGEGTDSEQYLQKFLQVRMAFPKTTTPDGEDSIVLRYLAVWSKQTDIDETIFEEICRPLEAMSMRREITLRDIQRIFAYAALLPDHFAEQSYPIRSVVIGGIFLKVLNPKLYTQLRTRSRNLARDEVLKVFYDNNFNNRSNYPQAFRFWDFWARILDRSKVQGSAEHIRPYFGDRNSVPADPPKWLADTVTEFLETFTFPETPT
jgi:energy-coupling factor transporter ATP-binding protein EcfA2